MKKTRNMLFVLMLALALLFTAACAPGGDAPPEEAPPAEVPPADTNGEEEAPPEEPAVAGGEVVWVIAADPPSLDPLLGPNDSATNDATAQMFEGLTYYREDLTIGGLLAESWEQTDEYTWIFYLREGIYFHDGTLFTAEAVELSMNWLLEPENASPRAFILDVIDEVTIIDDFTIQMVTEMPFAPLAAHLAHGAGFIASPDSVREAMDGGRPLGENPVGTGPFRFDSRVLGDHVRFVRNDDYWGGAPLIDSLVFRVAPEASVRLAMVETGEAQSTMVDLLLVGQALDTPSIETQRLPSTSLDYIGFNMQRYPLDNLELRRAITMAINKEDFLGIVDGNAVIATGPIAPIVVGAPAVMDEIPFDPDGARALIEELGYDGLELNIWYNDGNAARATIAELVQAHLREVGITVTISAIEWGAYLEMTADGQHDMFILGWTTLTADADYGLFPVFHSTLVGDPGNRTFLVDAEVDRLLEEARASTDPVARVAMYEELCQVIMDLIPFVPLYHRDWVAGLNGITGFTMNFNGVPDFRAVSLLG